MCSPAPGAFGMPADESEISQMELELKLGCWVRPQNWRFDVLWDCLTLSFLCASVETQAKEDIMWWITVTAFVVPETLILWLGIRSYRRDHS